MEVGEAITALVIEELESGECPFCDSKAGPDFEEKHMVNDASVLARHGGGMQLRAVTNPVATEDYEIFEKYWGDQDASRIVMSPHHLIPGNAALARCPQILKWMAGTVSIKKEVKNKPAMLAVKKINKLTRGLPKALREEKRQELIARELPPRPLLGDDEGVVRFALRGDKVDQHSEPERQKLVTGKIKFDVNDGENCMWLPSHCAIANWTDMESVEAWHLDQDPDEDPPIRFSVAYAFNCMTETGCQFHDAHGAYSRKVIEILKEVAVAVQRLAAECLEHPKTPSKKDGPYPAPATLTPALHRLAALLSEQLDIEKTFPAEPFFTSQLSLDAASL